MSEHVRRRIDVSAETHAWLDAEARRRGLLVRDLVERIVQEQAGREGAGQSANGHVNKVVQAAATGSLMTQLKELVARVDTLVERLAEDLPTSVSKGFDAIKDTIVKTGGTGHLRTMLTDHDAAHTARLDAMETASKTARETAGIEQATAIRNLETILVGNIKALKLDVEALHAWHQQRRWVAAAGAGAMLLLIVALGSSLADTPPTRWLAIRLTGNTRANDAAFTLAGDDRATGALMEETKGLLGDPGFRNDYTRCVVHAREVAKGFRCRITVPPIRPVTP
ncbi:MAG: hypothetical protein ABW128_23720 [Rhizorhabdus sp.]|jgi:hypothetical protein